MLSRQSRLYSARRTIRPLFSMVPGVAVAQHLPHPLSWNWVPSRLMASGAWR